MWLNKANTWAMINDIGGKDAINLCIDHTHTCYKGVRNIKHDWGYGCDDCPACHLRKNGYAEYKKFDT
jgi:7-cyano-7-deazaguanine synthase